MEGRFRVLGADVHVVGPERYVAPIAVAYDRFKILASPEPPAIRLTVSDDAREVRVNGRAREVAPGLDPGLVLYQRFLAEVLDATRELAVFHAGAVEAESGGLLLAGPTGHGKSSLTLGLVRRGMRFLSDDYAPVDLARRLVHPFPRTVSVVPGGSAPLAGELLRHAASGPLLFGKALVDVGRAFGEAAMAPDPVPLRAVVLLTGSPASATSPSWLELAVDPRRAAQVETALSEVGGVVLEERTVLPGYLHVRVRVEHGEGPTERLSSLLEDEGVLFWERSWGEAAAFDRPPEAAPLSRREAALLLVRELLNRRPGSRFLVERGGDLADLVLDVAQALRGAACWRVRAGRYEETVDLVASLAPAGLQGPVEGAR